MLVRQEECSALKQADEELIPPMICTVLCLGGNVNYILLCCFMHIKQNSPSAQPLHACTRTHAATANKHHAHTNQHADKDVFTLLEIYIFATDVSN